MRWHYRDGALLWLFPPAYAVHVLEQLVAGDGFLLVNAVGMVLLVAAVRRTCRDEHAGWMAIAIATLAAVNGMAHVSATLVSGRYSPGLISGVVLYIPLAALTLLRAAYQADGSTIGRGVAAGLAIQAAALVAARLLSRA